MEAQRLDRWLWCARLAKTRSGAQRAIEAGKARINGKRALKPSRLVQESDVVTATLLGKLFVVRVTGAAERRARQRSPADYMKTSHRRPRRRLNTRSVKAARVRPNAIGAGSRRCAASISDFRP